MQRHPKYTRDRIAQVGERIRALIWADARDPDVLRVAGPVDRIPVEDADGSTTAMPRWATPSGRCGRRYWFQVGATVPEEWAGERVDLLWISHSEATLWIGGRSVQGLNTSPMGARIDAPGAGAGGRRRAARPARRAGLQRQVRQARPRRSPRASRWCSTAARSPASTAEAWELHHDFDVLRRLEADAANGLDESWAGRLLAGLNEVCNVWVGGRPGRAGPRSREILGELLANRNGSHVHRLSAIGHGHLDTAWLWPLAETYRKAVRTFSSQTAYMERYPEFRFACSQAQQYDWIRTRNPDLYGRIRRQVEAGRWVPVGGTWIEPDCNLPSGESLVRQFLYGQRFFEREFGRRCNEFWNPDVFGYNGQLPQIMRGAGIGRFLTQKLSWNRFNPPPYHTFTWQGIDGSRGARALPAGRHLQRHGRGRRAAPHRARLQGPRPLRPQPAGVRLRRRRRRADAGDAGDAAPGRATCRACRARR